jgi:hypothetical protein
MIFLCCVDRRINLTMCSAHLVSPTHMYNRRKEWKLVFRIRIRLNPLTFGFPDLDPLQIVTDQDPLRYILQHYYVNQIDNTKNYVCTFSPFAHQQIDLTVRQLFINIILWCIRQLCLLTITEGSLDSGFSKNLKDPDTDRHRTYLHTDINYFPILSKFIRSNT